MITFNTQLGQLLHIAKNIADTREESSEKFSDSTSNDNFSIYTETSSSEDLQNLARTSTLSTTTHYLRERELNRSHLRNSRL